MPAPKMPAATENAAPSTVPPLISAERCVDSAALLGRQLSVTIRHHDEIYCLRQTRQGKLILTK